METVETKKSSVMVIKLNIIFTIACHKAAHRATALWWKGWGAIWEKELTEGGGCCFVPKYLFVHNRAGKFPKKIYAPGLKAGFWSKKCPQKAGEPYAQFSPSEIWVIVLTQILINVVTIAQISEGENWA